MSARTEVENYVVCGWRDFRVAEWVIKSLPLLEVAFSHPPCPIYTLSLDKGLLPKGKNDCSLEDFRRKQKVVMSGGFEGTEGHMKAVSDMWEVRGLVGPLWQSEVVLMLEPDSYITRRKKRSPIVNVRQRQELWSTSGKVDAVIVLPEKSANLSDEEYYQMIHKHIAPASWCANVENPSYFEIINRLQKQEVWDLVRFFVHKPRPHASFLDMTRNLTLEEVGEQLYIHLLDMVLSNRYEVNHLVPPDKEAQVIMNNVAREL